jgi:hypothetical protein
MPLQNRVAPDGTVFANFARGGFMGNRGGQMHDVHRQLTRRRWVTRQWISCVLQYKDRHETIMAPGRYTQLFFLDEATALAAGHRPCALCRRSDFLTFQSLWQNVHGLNVKPKAPDIDRQLHAERVDEARQKRVFQASLRDLPSGVIVRSQEQMVLLWRGLNLPWTPAGYLAPITLQADASVDVLTPRSIVRLLKAGYLPRGGPGAIDAS